MWSSETLLLIFAAGSVRCGQSCCNEESHLILRNITCADSGNISLTCTHGFFRIDSREEPEHFTQDGDDITLDYGESEYCIATVGVKVQRAVALVCFDPPPNPIDWTFIALMILSLPFLLVTLFVYSAVPTLRDLSGKCVIGYVASLTVNYASVVTMNLIPDSSQVVCSLRGGLLYYSTISTFAWLNLVTFNLWKSVRSKTYRMSDKKLFLVYLLWSVGLPLLVCAFVVILSFIPDSHFFGHFTLYNCWFTDSIALWSLFYTPMTILVLLNIIMCVHSCWILWRGYRDPTQSRIRLLRLRCMMILKLFLISGVPWIFEVISASLKDILSNYVWIAVDCLNAAQGVVIFIILVACHKRALRAIHRHRLCGLPWPESWGEYNADSATINEADKVALEQIKQQTGA